jgi:hypothetical protein
MPMNDTSNERSSAMTTMQDARQKITTPAVAADLNAAPGDRVACRVTRCAGHFQAASASRGWSGLSLSRRSMCVYARVQSTEQDMVWRDDTPSNSGQRPMRQLVGV